MKRNKMENRIEVMMKELMTYMPDKSCVLCGEPAKYFAIYQPTSTEDKAIFNVPLNKDRYIPYWCCEKCQKQPVDVENAFKRKMLTEGEGTVIDYGKETPIKRGI